MASPAPPVAWITGASQGIGRALALELAQRGWKVAASARNRERLQLLEAESVNLAGTISAFPLDVCDPHACVRVAERVAQRLGPVERLLLNAGTHIPTPVSDLVIDDFRQLFELNLMGTLQPLAAVLPAMQARGRGQLAIVASVAGYRGLPLAAGYGASKAALINLAESLRLDLDQQGIDVRLINPGFVKTPLTDRNRFKMPFLIEASDAARRIADGLERKGFEIRFPRRLVWLMGLLRWLPYAIYFPLVKRITGV
jgi:short-subunit dehydrogenase